eukprot:GHVU01047748.1.p1 GENE.GHVU01047748.1~~GHVU01047748.1.p1  ORF type:complete len:151 (+),score=9.00 GHVU01047748.1:1804-2256(+)
MTYLPTEHRSIDLFGDRACIQEQTIRGLEPEMKKLIEKHGEDKAKWERELENKVDERRHEVSESNGEPHRLCDSSRIHFGRSCHPAHRSTALGARLDVIHQLPNEPSASQCVCASSSVVSTCLRMHMRAVYAFRYTRVLACRHGYVNACV